MLRLGGLANYRMKYSKNELINNHINGIKNFWDMLNIDYINLKDKENLFYIKECKFRYNTKTKQKFMSKTVNW